MANGSLQAKLASPARPGYLTSEFWTTVIVQVVSAVVAIASLITHTPFDASGLQPLIPVAALVAAGVAQAWYSHSRANVKVAAVNNGVNTEPVAPVVYNINTPPAPVRGDLPVAPTPDPAPVAPPVSPVSPAPTVDPAAPTVVNPNQ